MLGPLRLAEDRFKRSTCSTQLPHLASQLGDPGRVVAGGTDPRPPAISACQTQFRTRLRWTPSFRWTPSWSATCLIAPVLVAGSRRTSIAARSAPPRTAAAPQEDPRATTGSWSGGPRSCSATPRNAAWLRRSVQPRPVRGPPVVGEHVLHHQGVDVDQGGLQHARAVLFRWNVRRCCSMAEGRVAAVFKLNGRGFDLRRGVARSVVMLVPLVVLGVLDQQKYLVSVAFGALFEGLCDPGGD